MTRPILFLDVDGVLNPYAGRAVQAAAVAEYKMHDMRPPGWEDPKQAPLKVWLSRIVGTWLVEFAEKQDIEMVWATTWEHAANTMIGPAMGLPELPVVEFGFAARRWKWPAVLKFAGDRPLIWLDDDFQIFEKERILTGWDLHRQGIPTLLRKIDPRIGITKLDLAAVGRCLENL